MSATTAPAVLAVAAAGPPRSLWSDARRRLARNRAAVASACFLGFVVLACFAAPHLPGLADPAAQDLRLGAAPPSAARPFGTDELGRDLFVRVLYGCSWASVGARSPAMPAASWTSS
jgi:ABC-type dipeptide/oligopeptide/nickel transport system permease subunit